MCINAIGIGYMQYYYWAPLGCLGNTLEILIVKRCKQNKLISYQQKSNQQQQHSVPLQLLQAWIDASISELNSCSSY